MKFCRWTLYKISEELKDISEENKQGSDSKSRTLTNFVAFEELYGRQASRKTRSFIEQRNISFQNDISLIIKP